MPPRALEASGHPAHDLDPAGDDQVVVPRGHPGRGEMDGLLGRAALAVDRRGGYPLGQPGGDPAVAGDVGALFAHLAHAPGDDVVDALGVEAGPLQQTREGEREEVGRVPVRQGAPALAERRAHDVDDDRFSRLAHENSSRDAPAICESRLPLPAPHESADPVSCSDLGSPGALADRRAGLRGLRRSGRPRPRRLSGSHWHLPRSLRPVPPPEPRPPRVLTAAGR